MKLSKIIPLAAYLPAALAAPANVAFPTRSNDAVEIPAKDGSILTADFWRKSVDTRSNDAVEIPGKDGSVLTADFWRKSVDTVEAQNNGKRNVV